MTTGKVNLKPDVVLKQYWSRNEEFADFFNAILFNGKMIIRPDDLEEADTDSSVLIENSDAIESIHLARDTIRIRKRIKTGKIELVLLGMEHQEHIHYAMPLRVMGMDYSAYKKQYDQNARTIKDQKGLSKDEYLSGMKKTDKLIPVITIVVYYGEKPWDGALNIKQMLDIPRDFRKYVCDYKMLLVEARKLDSEKNQLQLHNSNNQDFFYLLGIILNNEMSRKQKREIIENYEHSHAISPEVVKTVAGTVSSGVSMDKIRKRGMKMCTFFNELIKEGEEIGEARGLELGIAEGENRGKIAGLIAAYEDMELPENKIIEKLQQKLDLSLSKATEYLKLYGKQMV